MNLQNYYIENYPTDNLGADIDSHATFIDIMGAILGGRDVYLVMGVVDSIVRERLFEGLSEMMVVPYATIYELYLNS